MNIEKFLLLSICMALVGCDTFHGPKLRNESGGVAELVVTYSTKETISSTWPECSGTFLGAPGVKVIQIIVRSGSEEIVRIEEPEIEKMIATEKEVSGYHAWVIRDNEITFVTEQASDLCYQGKPLENR